MNKILKTSLSIAVALIAGASAATLAGCVKDPEEYEKGSNVIEYTIAKNVFIVSDETLHKGDILTYRSDGYAGVNGDNGYRFNCLNEDGDRKVEWGSLHSYNYEPDAKLYDQKCKECFSK